MLAIPNAEANVCVAVTMYPVMIGAERAEIWLLKLVIPAMVATLPRGAIRDGTVQATGAAADRPCPSYRDFCSRLAEIKSVPQGLKPSAGQTPRHSRKPP